VRDKVYTVVFMVAVAGVFTGAVSAVNLLSRERVRLNQELARKRVIMEVLGIAVPPEAGLKEVAALYGERVEETGRQIVTDVARYPILAGCAEDGSLLAYAFEVSGSGFWDVIKGYIAIEPDLETIRGIAFYQQNETPGLGAEITEPWFEKQFEGRKLPREVPADGRLVRFVPPGTEPGPHEVDAITGATQTSKAVERFLNEDLRNFLEAMKTTGTEAEGGRS
jgi:Na+-transporting NADH:ubiquinone oxidoreductase subunit C